MRGGKLTTRIQAGASNQESINIGQGGELGRVIRFDGTTVQDAGLVGSLLRHFTLDPLADRVMGILSLLHINASAPPHTHILTGSTNLRSGNLSGTNGPDRLVSNDNLGPVLADGVENGLELAGDNLDGVVVLALLEAFAAAKDDAEAGIERSLGLGRNKLVALAKDAATLRVAEDHPLNGCILELLGADLAGVGSVALIEDVLGGDLDIGAEGGLCEKEVESGGGDDDLWGCV